LLQVIDLAMMKRVDLVEA